MIRIEKGKDTQFLSIDFGVATDVGEVNKVNLNTEDFPDAAAKLEDAMLYMFKYDA